MNYVKMEVDFLAQTKSKTKKSTSTAKVKSAKKKRQDEIYGILLICLGLLLLISLLLAGDATESGKAGRFLVNIATGLAGKGKLLLPFFCIVWGGSVFMGKKQSWRGQRFLGVFFIFASILSFFHLKEELMFLTYYLTNGLQGAGGGVIGAIFSFFTRFIFGQTGSIIILTAILLIGIMLLLDISWVDIFAKLYNKWQGWRKDRSRRIAEKEKEERRELRELERERKRAVDGPPPVMERKFASPPPLIIDHEAEEVMQTTAEIAPVITESKGSPAANGAEAQDVGKATTMKKNPFSRNFLMQVSKKQEEAMQEEKRERPIIRQLDREEDGLKVRKEIRGADIDCDIPCELPKTNSTNKLGNEEHSMQKPERPYVLPSTNLLTAGIKVRNPRMNTAITENIEKLESTLSSFGVEVKVTQVVSGPAITRYELQPSPGVKVSKIVNLADDIALSLAASQVRIEAPVPGKSVVGIEVPKDEVSTVYFRDVLESAIFKENNSKLSLALGKDITGEAIVGDLAKMPHLLIAGATGAGKSVCINTIIASILYKATPKQVKFLLIDPKKVEMTSYIGLPHLISPVVTDPKKAAGALKWIVGEMEKRYSLFAGTGVKDFQGYNKAHEDDPLHQIVVIIDELADLMMVAHNEVEESICRLAQMARAAGIHLVVATQRPSVDVITGLIKANIPSRIAFAVTSNTDSRTILDMGGAEKLLGKGDMLYHPVGLPKPLRVQGAFISEQDTQKLVAYCCKQASPVYMDTVVAESPVEKKVSPVDKDALFLEAGRLIINTGQASTSFLQRRLSIGNPRAGRLMDMLQEAGVVGGPDGAKPRTILMTLQEFEETFSA